MGGLKLQGEDTDKTQNSKIIFAIPAKTSLIQQDNIENVNPGILEELMNILSQSKTTEFTKIAFDSK